MSDLGELVERSLTDEAAAAFMERVRAQASDLEEAIAAGEFDNADFAVGLEMEVYAVTGEDEGQARLAALPTAVFGEDAAKELGRHNAELNTDPDVLDASGLATQARHIEASFERAQERAREHGRELVLDAMWTLPPADGSYPYLATDEEVGGVAVAANMRPDPRYVAIDHEVRRLANGEIPFEVPGVERTFPSILFESLATSIQPHLQVPTAAAFPAYYSVAIRTLGPVLALSTNSPFLPPDLYNAVEDPQDLLETTHHELRIVVFEQSVNQSPAPKVKVPRDIETATDTIDRVVADDLYAPFLREWLVDDERETLADRLWEFTYKRSTYWRWLRCVVGGDPVEGDNDEQSLRIEYRPIPTQPTVRDVVGMQCLTVGLIHGLVTTDHPLADLPWTAAEESFYTAAQDGLEADLTWVTADGSRTNDSGVIFDEVFEYARRGLADVGLDAEGIDRYLEPIEARHEAGVTPSTWKQDRVREALDAGLSLPEAIREMQVEYIERSRETESFSEWF